MNSRYSATIASGPRPLRAGEKTNLAVRITRPDGSPVTRFEKAHTEEMHLVLVSSDLEDFQHLHPALRADGSLTTQMRLSRAQPYAVFAEFEPKGGHEELASTRLVPADGRFVEPRLDRTTAFDGSKPREWSVDGARLRVRLENGSEQKIGARVTARLRIEIRSEKGAPAPIEPWLGMPAHMIVLSPDFTTFLHVHGMDPGAEHGGHGDHHGHDAAKSTTSEPVFEITLPEPGLYKAFLQFKRAGRVITAPFVVAAD